MITKIFRDLLFKNMIELADNNFVRISFGKFENIPNLPT